MKSLALAVLFAVMQAPSPVPRKAADNPTRASRDAQNQATANKAPTAPAQAPINTSAAPSNENPANAVRTEDAQKPVRIGEFPPVSVAKDWTDRAYWAFSALLVIVGGLQAWFLYRTFKVVSRQAQSMRYQTTILRDSAAAAKNSVEALINSERAWLLVDIDWRMARVMNVNENGVEKTAVDILFACRNQGKTPCWITEKRIELGIVESLPPIPDLERIQLY